MQVHSIGCSRLQNGCQLHYHTVDRVLTSGCSFISQHIWIKICIVLAILGICIMGKKISALGRSMSIHISSRQIDYLGTLSSAIVTRWCGCCSGHRSRRRWSQLSASVVSSCIYSLASLACLQILCGAISARKASIRVVLTKHCQGSFYRNLHQFMLRILNYLCLLFSDFSTGLLDQILRYLYSKVRKSSFGHFGNIQSKADVRWFQLYQTSLPCHSSRHDETLQEISCCC